MIFISRSRLKLMNFVGNHNHVRSHSKLGPDRFSRFDVYWIQTDRQTYIQSIIIDIYF